MSVPPTGRRIPRPGFTATRSPVCSRQAGAGIRWSRRPPAGWRLRGPSEHQTGLALDIVSADYQLLDEQQAQTPEQQWLMAHCWEYGFVLRYPTDKCAVTGIGYEPWHYRYVGKEAAREMQQKGLCLEEYLASDTQSNFQKEDGQEAQQGADAGQNGSSAPKTQSKPVVPEAPDMAVV